jgi:hypothetical protein
LASAGQAVAGKVLDLIGAPPHVFVRDDAAASCLEYLHGGAERARIVDEQHLDVGVRRCVRDDSTDACERQQ